ncbi:uncharacterized protein LOC134612215 [Pelobates fuscus]|uniref:uncharacterized protein LOC134612215 n=1 Tax=Pelobates fuscus TaxID=191477 RepID=UPI002FE48D3F
MSDSVLNNSWPSFSKLWMKRWSFKRASECKPCSGFIMAEEKDDASVDLDECSHNAASSSEDLHSLDSSLQGTEYYKDLVIMEPSPKMTPKRSSASFCVAGETNISFDKGEVIITYTKPLLCPVACGSRSPQGLNVGGAPGERNYIPQEEEDIVEVQEPIPILVRSLSTSRRHSWDDAVTPTDSVRRCAHALAEYKLVIIRLVK